MTKALVRNAGETITEDCGLSFIQWKTGAPLTNPKWYGGPYKLIENYVPPMDEEEDITQPKQSEVEEKIVEDDNIVIIDGKRYSKEKLRSLIE